VSITTQLMFMTLNSPIFWYKPRAGETKADIEGSRQQGRVCALRGWAARKDKMASNLT
jgi:hypothetical protein